MLWSDIERRGRFFDPWREFELAQRQRLRANAQAGYDFPTVNIWISEDNAVVSTEIPGLEPDALEVSVINNSLTLKGSRKPEALKEGEAFHRRERWSGTFSKTIELPFAVESGKVQARFTKGVLYISLPRAEADKPKKITVKSE
jgi:HSP20 family protein